MTSDEIKAQVEAVREAAKAQDYPLAFSLEISIWFDTLEAISDGAWDSQDMAKAALSTLSLKFPRQVAS